MYRGFNLRLKEESLNNEFQEQNKGFLDNSKVKQNIRTQFEKYLDARGKLDGTKMQEDWFPTVNAHVFISHSHQDEILAGLLANRLFEQFGIISFIDSFVWGYADELLKTIDDKYCLKDDERTYSYQTRNYSTSHVHMMLATALTKMIDKTECIIFLNTPNSVVSDGIVNRTYSPWIYHEIATTNTIRRKAPVRVLLELSKSAGEQRSLGIAYNLDFRSLNNLDQKVFYQWMNGNEKTATDALDELYKMVPNDTI